MFGMIVHTSGPLNLIGRSFFVELSSADNDKLFAPQIPRSRIFHALRASRTGQGQGGSGRDCRTLPYPAITSPSASWAAQVPQNTQCGNTASIVIWPRPGQDLHEPPAALFAVAGRGAALLLFARSNSAGAETMAEHVCIAADNSGPAEQ